MSKPVLSPKQFLAATELSSLENQNVRGGGKRVKRKVDGIEIDF